MFSTPTTTLTPPQIHGESNIMSLPNKAPNLDVVYDFVKKSATCSSEWICKSDIEPEVILWRVK